MAVQPDKWGYGVSVGGHALLLAAGLFAFSSTPTPLKLDSTESVPVEIVSDAPPEAMRGQRQAVQQPTPQRVIDRQAPEEKETEDDEATPVARERVQNTVRPPPPAPRPPVQRPDPVDTAPPPPPRPQQVAAVQPPPTPAPTPPRPAPPRQPTAEQREELTEKLAELQAAQQQREVRERQERERREQQQRETREREAREKAERERQEQAQREARERAERQARERAEREARERRQREARERAERERQERANAREFDPNSIASRLSNANAANNDRRQATRTEATGSAAPTRTASLGTQTGTGARLTGSELDAFRNQVSQCWSPPAAIADSTGLIPVIEVSFNQDGSVNGRPVVANNRSDPAFQAAAGAAVRAIMRCSPYRLPPQKYDTWRDMRVRFDPRDMMR